MVDTSQGEGAVGTRCVAQRPRAWTPIGVFRQLCSAEELVRSCQRTWLRNGSEAEWTQFDPKQSSSLIDLSNCTCSSMEVDYVQNWILIAFVTNRGKDVVWCSHLGQLRG